MASYFQLSTAGGMSTLKLDSQGRATVQYTVKNVSARPIDGRAILVSLPVSTPPKGAVENGWVKIAGKADRHFDVDQEETFPVAVSVPPKGSPDKYTFRMDVVWVDKPDEGDAGPAVSFEVPKQDRPPAKFPLWLIPVIVAVLAGVGVGIWFLIPHGPKVPDLRGKTVAEATTALTAAKLTLDPNVERIQSEPANADKVVSQSPTAGTKAKEGDPVHLKVGAQMVTVPTLVGLAYEQAQTLLTSSHLTVGQVTKQTNSNFPAGVVISQNPAQGASVSSGSAVDLSVTPSTTGDQGSFVATWVNDNATSPAVTRLVITQYKPYFITIHAYGKCSPTDCDWGALNGTIMSGTASVVWDQGFVKRTMNLSLDSVGHLRSVVDSVYNDGRAPQHWVETFHKT